VTSGISSTDRVWNLNSLFDPDFTGAGHQPRQYDSWSGIYARYLVTRVDVELTVRQRAAHGIGVVVVPTNGSTALTAAGYPAELRRASKVMVTSSNQPPAFHKGTYLPAAINGVSEAVYRADDRFQSSIGASPTESLCLHTFVYALDGATTVDMEYTLLMTFHAEFFDLVNPGISLLDRALLSSSLPAHVEEKESENVYEVVRRVVARR